ncbi:MAG: SGNH/GDSL hydrolase family protein [Richelia sp. RM2_1_2]|nr:SGNH/GDSL hydrolase family protein [Richelia sp. SM1_7_0]NJN11937.1 SGNH/GDSL hydrolase family protein [Richelia sp. RM1_1_1]NJO30005.1 SGNH/GDSL hydrolase family protein [Richelia sp. SL_2_1]NJO63597.1 SGNH/GDSL hydrolase family protein [Richelia sp. RM2_1_2]
MKKAFAAAGCVLFSFMLSPKAIAGNFSQFSQFYVFGDSLSDTGNVFAATEGLTNPETAIPPNPPYAPGRFSNGDIWVDFVGKEIGLTPTTFIPPQVNIPTEGINFAIGGSSSGLNNALVPDAPLPGVLGQVGLFTQNLIANNQKADPNALYTVWGGANDYIFGNVTDPNQTVGNLSQAINSLTQAGAKNIAVFNLPDLGQLPFAIATNTSAQLSQLTLSHNAALEQVLNSLSGNSDINIIPIDVNSPFKRVVANPGEFGFTQNPAIPCVVGDIVNISSVCDNPDEFVFFDAFHPSSKSHRLVADVTLSAIKHETVPEPSTLLSSLVVGAIGTAGVLRQRRKIS